jgi:hypothetical protein
MQMTTNTPVHSSRAHLEAFFSRVSPARGRVIVAIDATESRRPTWDMAAHLQAQMFETVAMIGSLETQLVHYRGCDEFVALQWISDPKILATIMSQVHCSAGHTQIQKVLSHTRKEHAREKVDALIIVSDACEETAPALYGEASALTGVPVFMFQEGDDERISEIYAEIARITSGAHCKFDANAAQRLADLLKAVAAFAAGGVKALASQKTEAASLLLTQLKK